MQIVALDLEGVLVPEIWIAFSERTGIPELRRTTRDEPDYDKLMKFRLELLKRHGLGLPDIQRVIAAMGPEPGAKDFLDALRTRHQVVILSDTFYEFAMPLMAQLGMPTLFCHRLETDAKGFVTGYRLRMPDQKRASVRALKSIAFKVIAAALVIYELPAVQNAFLAVTRGAIAESGGVLGIAGKAYGTGNVLIAAGATFAINFALGSLLQITLLSAIVPGAGALTAALRATMWGVLLAPTLVSLSAGMLPHAFTLLVEGEAYVLAAFFGLLIPIYLFQSAGQQTLGERYRRALVLNLQGCVLVALVLLVAAGYEAVEFILMMR